MMDPTTTVAILGGDPAVVRALDHLVSGAGYAAKLLPEPLAEGLGEALAGVGLLLMAPALSEESREALLAGIRATPEGTQLPVLEMPWPCGTEDLKRTIEEVLSTRMSPEGLGSHD